MCVGGERDVRSVNKHSNVPTLIETDLCRAAYCVMVVLSLLSLPLELPSSSPGRLHGDETFLTGLGEWLGRCKFRLKRMFRRLV